MLIIKDNVATLFYYQRSVVTGLAVTPSLAITVVSLVNSKSDALLFCSPCPTLGFASL